MQREQSRQLGRKLNECIETPQMVAVWHAARQGVWALWHSHQSRCEEVVQAGRGRQGITKDEFSAMHVSAPAGGVLLAAALLIEESSNICDWEVIIMEGVADYLALCSPCVALSGLLQPLYGIIWPCDRPLCGIVCTLCGIVWHCVL